MSHSPEPLDALLTASAPPTITTSAEVRAALDDLVASSRPRWGWRRLLRRAPLTVGAVGVLLVGGTGVAVASGGLPAWFGWAQQPDGVVHFTLPSGAECEQRIGEIVGEPEAAAVAAEIVDDPSLLERLDMDAAFEMVGVGEPPTDNEYRMAVSWAVGEHVAGELRERGFHVSLHSISSQSICPGAEW